jgi:cellulose synthase/poly-beta-1,6-N-acetylglucosamine synthase-like glycosyltransferase
VAYSYLIYPLILGILSVLFSRRIRAQDGYEPTVGVVIPAYNEKQVITKKIANVLALDYPADKLSVWVGSDCSTDGTDDVVRSAGDTRVHLWVAPRRGGKTQVLNLLIPDVPADIILLTDANTMHMPSSLRLLVRSFADESVGAVAGRVDHVVSQGVDSLEETLYRSFEMWQKRHESALHSTISAFGGFYAIRKKLFVPIPPNSYSNDDVLIPMNVIRRGFRVVFDGEAISQEDISESIKLEFRRRIRIGAGNFQAFFRLLDFLNPLKGWPAFCYVSHKASRWFSPLFLFAGVAACGLLSYVTPFAVYRIIFGAGIGLVVIGLLYKVLRLNLLRPVFYFISMNTALFLGLFRFLGGIRSAAWSRTERLEARGTRDESPEP